MMRFAIEDHGRLKVRSSSVRAAAAAGAMPLCFASAATSFLSSAALHDFGRERRNASLRL